MDMRGSFGLSERKICETISAYCILIYSIKMRTSIVKQMLKNGYRSHIEVNPEYCFFNDYRWIKSAEF